MKKIFFSAMLAAAVLASCSSENELKPGAGEVAEGETGYVGFSIELPTTAGTRANDEFDDGDPRPDEYKVNNATLFLFGGTNEADAEFIAAYPMNITNFAADGKDDDQCTTEGIVTAEILKPVAQDFFAYVVLNHNNMVTVTQTSGATPASTTTINGQTLAAGTSFADFSKLEMQELGNAGDLVMTNTPVCDKTGGAAEPASGAKITTLAKLDKTKIYATEAKAQNNPAGEVYVERAAAKITVKATMADDAAIGSDPTVKYTKASIKWAVNNVNKSYYNARQMKTEWLGYAADGEEGTVNAATKYRFLSGAAIHAGVVRTYWAEDMNYSNGDITGFRANPTATDITTPAQDGKSVYVTENTFDVAHQAEKHTTGLSISATFNDGKDFYIASTYGANKMLQRVGAGSATVETVEDYIKKYLYNNNNGFKTWLDSDKSATFAITMSDDAATGTAKVENVVLTGSKNLPQGIDAKYINNLITFKFYKGGVAYYNLLVKHFGDAETPWNREKHTENTIAGIYNATAPATPESNFLGRYGIVRNNWYQIEVSGISQIGDPIVVTPGDTPDDKTKNYLSVKIHILPWAVRKQSEIL
ncbi:MAG TPA: hypothetical protein DC006_02525 [Prevotellaceae bacterium]|nr:hypothetical protein [Prevotellaceae bacterium]HBE54727.1 hypothetical protein [Prevotellaceae bacterium]